MLPELAYFEPVRVCRNCNEDIQIREHAKKAPKNTMRDLTLSFASESVGASFYQTEAFPSAVTSPFMRPNDLNPVRSSQAVPMSQGLLFDMPRPAK